MKMCLKSKKISQLKKPENRIRSLAENKQQQNSQRFIAMVSQKHKVDKKTIGLRLVHWGWGAFVSSESPERATQTCVRLFAPFEAEC